MIVAIALAAALAAPPTMPVQPAATPENPQDTMDALQQVYDQSCGSRGYGQYDDVCNSIQAQIRVARKELLRHPPKLQSSNTGQGSAATSPPSDMPK